MLHEEKKVTKIVEELTIFFMGIGSTEIATKLKKDGNLVLIHFEANYDTCYEHRLDDMEELLREQRNEVMEDIYWELAGSGDPGETSQLLLIGMMVEDAKVERKDGYLIIELTKRLE